MRWALHGAGDERGRRNPLALPKWTQSTGEELANSISHGIGLVGAIIGTPILLLAAFHHGSISFLIGTIVFTVTMLLLYLGSTLYHAWPQTPGKIYPASAGSLRDFFIDCGNIHAVCARSAARSLGLDDAGTCLGVGRFGRIHQGDPRHCAPQEIRDDSLSGNGLAGSHFYPAACAGGSAFRGALAFRRWNRLYDRRVVLRAEACALFSFRLAFVRPYRHGLSFYRSAYLRALT